ncbi:MAG: histidine--tRNA ligase, partial [Erysipelotrichaceae bacterium]|nr:histidine--tRNA ligase [Erysipelotrichaceae bacterium]
MERLLIALEDQATSDDEGIDAYLMPLGDQARDVALQLATVLRANGFTIDMDYVGRGLKGQFKSADRFKAALNIIIGDEEVEGGYVQVRNKKTREQAKVNVDEIVDYMIKYFEG